jgi:uncharacterized protein
MDPPPPVSPAFFGLLLATTVGWGASVSLIHLLAGRRMRDYPFDNGMLLTTIAFEGMLAAIWLPQLVRRGWTLRCVTLPLSVRDLPRGLGLLGLSYVAYYLTYALCTWGAPDLAQAAAAEVAIGHPDWWAVCVGSALNPVFEEFLYLGFAAGAVRRKGAGMALAASVLLRLITHLYQGAMAVVSILPIGIVFGWYYLRTGRLWPVVLAHGLMDLTALGLFLERSG